jgi:uncharacterized SAM-binding protein YcdF (DUF218 family)
MVEDLYFYISKIATPLVVPSNIFIFLLIIFFYISFVKKNIFVRKFFISIFIIFSIISVFPIGNNLIYFFLEKKFYFPQTPSKIDYIFVPAGSIKRTIIALNFLDNSNLREAKIIFSPGIPYLDKNNSKDIEASLVKSLISTSKIRSENIIFLPDARNTFENFKRLKEFLIKKNKDQGKILLITDAFHMKRSLMMAKKFNLNISSLPSSYITKKDSVGLINSYQKISILNNLRQFDIFIKEMISLNISRFL